VEELPAPLHIIATSSPFVPVQYKGVVTETLVSSQLIQIVAIT